MVLFNTKLSPSEFTRCAFGSAPIGLKERALPASKMDAFLVSELGNHFRVCLWGSGGGHYYLMPHGGDDCVTTQAMSIAMG